VGGGTKSGGKKWGKEGEKKTFLEKLPWGGEELPYQKRSKRKEESTGERPKKLKPEGGIQKKPIKIFSVKWERACLFEGGETKRGKKRAIGCIKNEARKAVGSRSLRKKEQKPRPSDLQRGCLAGRRVRPRPFSCCGEICLRLPDSNIPEQPPRPPRIKRRPCQRSRAAWKHFPWYRARQKG